MNNKKSIKRNVLIAITDCICAVVWDITLLVELLYGYTSEMLFLAHIICAIAWNILAISAVIRLMKSKSEDNK